MINYLTSKLLTVVDGKKNKEEVIRLLADMVSENSDAVEDKDLFLERLFQREEVGTTGIGMGIVVPHARCESLNKIIIAVALLENPIEFNTPDGVDAKLVILVGAPKNNNKEYLDLLAKIARKFRYKEYRENILEASSKEELIEALSGI
ncbi:PTS sugar transporter subunit IIA [uncultured Ilyobacter sp.]|jgi:mannitol/fructose-specific phosphotransferase system IIA component (Ntr-type)|uniref:PTS sugar transporter subunit IIA n=1 Tax=uncultured Ilyobacter sp. TaxID=544433 RepID=UPI0029C090BF|nr:PTS sugar transporter subunit IIA [uncultured Ilyobacter sp.]